LPTPPEESKDDFQGTGDRGPSAAPPATSKEVHSAAAKPSPQTAEPGAEDLAIAERYLNDHPGPSGSATAAGYLWAAVKKGSVEAELTLAELYIRGEGVPKNCGQARVLLSAAAKKGNQTASEELAQLVRNGCR
jgi:TPR repeat protein